MEKEESKTQERENIKLWKSNALKLRKGKILNYGKECIKTQEWENIKLWKGMH
jgi:hypothetical protein